MFKLPILVVLGLVTCQVPEASRLVEGLGAAKFAAREEAAKALEDLGRSALAELDKAIRESKDEEVRQRAVLVRDRIEVASLTRATMVRFDKTDMALLDAIATINAQLRCRPALWPDLGRGQRWDGRRVRLEGPTTMPFWKAVDLVCGQGALHAAPGPPGGGLLSRNGMDPVFGLFLRDNAPYPKSAGLPYDAGPFRVTLLSLTTRRVNGEGPVPDPPATVRPNSRGNPHDEAIVAEQRKQTRRGGTQAHFSLAAEPHLMIALTGNPKFIEATDEQGRSLLPQPLGIEGEPNAPHFGAHAQNSYGFACELNLPEEPGPRVKVLRGIARIGVAACKPYPVRVPLGDGVGKSFPGDGGRIEVLARKGRLGEELSYEVAIHLDVPSKIGLVPNGPADRFDRLHAFMLQERELTQSPDFPEMRLEVVDADDRCFRLYITSTRREGDAIRMTIGLRNDHVPDPVHGGLSSFGEPVELRFYGLARTLIELPFEFHDVPLP